MGIGIGIFLGDYFARLFDMKHEVTIPSMLFIFGGLGLIAGFFITRRLEDNEN
jgi:hypothetical protein